MTAFEVYALVPEYRTYTVVANSEDEARIAVLNDTSNLDYDTLGDDDERAEVIEVQELGS